LPDQGRFREADELLEGGDTQTLQPLDHERIHREDGDGAGGQEGRELTVRNQNGPSGAGTGRRHPGTEFSGSPAHPGNRYQGARKNPKEGLQSDPNLPDRRSVEAFHPIHPQEYPAPAGGLHHRAQLHEGFYHLLLCDVVVGRVRLQEGEGGTEGNGLGNHLAGAGSRFGSPLRYLPEGPARTLTR